MRNTVIITITVENASPVVGLTIIGSLTAVFVKVVPPNLFLVSFVGDCTCYWTHFIGLCSRTVISHAIVIDFENYSKSEAKKTTPWSNYVRPPPPETFRRIPVNVS